MHNPDYQKLYHLLNSRRGEELRMLEDILSFFQQTDQLVDQYDETQGEPVLTVLPGGHRFPELDGEIDAFLYKLDHRFHLKRFGIARATLKILLLEEDHLTSMTAIYNRVAEEVGGTKAQVERNLRSFRYSVKEADTNFYRATLADFNTTNADFYWNALHVLKEEMK